jgi:dephospho-CoA kinase
MTAAHPSPPPPSRPPRPKPTIGLTGGIGSGKSTVARQFARLGCAVIDADELARAALQRPDVVQQLQQWWGAGVLRPDGGLDRPALARIVFADPGELRRLEELVHPLVHAARLALRQEYDADPRVVAIVEDCPLLLEKGIDRYVDHVVFVAAPPEQRAARVRARDWDSAELSRREKNQAPLDTKARRADYVVENNAGEAECFAHVRRVLAQILQKSG